MDKVTKIYVCWKLYKSGISPEKIPLKVKVHRATVYRWLKGIQRKGIRQFVRDYKLAKKGRRQRKTDLQLEKMIYEIRRTKRDCCGQKIQYFLKRDYGVILSVSTIYRILGKKYSLRGKWKKNMKRGKVLKGSMPREAVQMDTVDFGGVFAFTAIDTYTREASVILKPFLDSKAGEESFIEHLKRFGRIEHLQRDGGKEFKGECEKRALQFVKKLRTAKPYKKNEQAFIERFNGILRKECLGYGDYTIKDIPLLNQKLQEFLNYYHFERPHLSLNMLTPHQFVMSHLT